MSEEVAPFYICSRCLRAQESSGDCPKCGIELRECRPGSADDPRRRPLMDQEGQVRTRAPLWWLRHSVRRLVKRPGDE